MVRRIRVTIGKYARVVMRTKNDLRTLVISFCDDILDGMPQRFRLLDLHLPACLDEFLPHPLLDFGMSFRPRYARPESNLLLHVHVGALTVERNGIRRRLRTKRKNVPANYAGEDESND